MEKGPAGLAGPFFVRRSRLIPFRVMIVQRCCGFCAERKAFALVRDHVPRHKTRLLVTGARRLPGIAGPMTNCDIGTIR